jgi:NitT/TauT family transport system permease protein
MEDIVRTKLKQVVARYGRDLITNPRLPEILRENLGSEYKLEASVLNAAVQFGIPQRLCTLEPGNLTSTTLSNMAAGMAATAGFKEELAASAVAVWAEALGLTPSTAKAINLHDGGERDTPVEESNARIGGSHDNYVALNFAGWLLVIGALLLAWYSTSAVVHNNLVVPYPHEVVLEVFRLAVRPDLLVSLGATTFSALLGVALGLTLFLPVQGLVTRSPNKFECSRPLITILLMLPPIVFTPWIVSNIGVNIWIKALVIAYAAWLAGLASVVPQERPWALPSTTILRALRPALGLAWTTAIVFELFTVEPGMGQLLMNLRNTDQTVSMYAAIILLACVIAIVDRVGSFAINKLARLRGPSATAMRVRSSAEAL